MKATFDEILRKPDLDREDIKVLLSAEGAQMESLLRRGLEVKLAHLCNKTLHGQCPPVLPALDVGHSP